MRRALGTLGIALVSVAATPANFGGWAVVTFDDVPEYLEVGKSTMLSFKIRQHGMSLREDLSPTLTLRDADAGWLSRILKRDKVPANLSGPAGSYETTFTPHRAGRFILVVDTDLFGWTTNILPIQVVALGESADRMTPYQRGQQLFAAKGCVVCHQKLDDPDLADIRVVPVGPALTDRVFDDEWLSLKLADPASYRTTVVTGVEMPDLELRQAEIASIVQYINGRHETIVTSR